MFWTWVVAIVVVSALVWWVVGLNAGAEESGDAHGHGHGGHH